MQGFSSSALATFWTEKFFAVENCPLNYRLLSSISGPCPLVSSCAPLSCDNQKCLQTAKCLLGGKITLDECHCCNIVHEDEV